MFVRIESEYGIIFRLGDEANVKMFKCLPNKANITNEMAVSEYRNCSRDEDPGSVCTL